MQIVCMHSHEYKLLKGEKMTEDKFKWEAE